MVTLADISRKPKICMKDKNVKIIEKGGQRYNIEFGTVEFENKIYPGIRLIEINYSTDFEYLGKKYENSLEVKNDFIKYIKNEDFEKAVGLRLICKEKYEKNLDSIAEEIAERYPYAKLKEVFAFSPPYRKFLVDPSVLKK